MDPDEVAELCQDFFTDHAGDDVRLVDVEVDDDVIRLLVEPGNGIDGDDDRLAEVLDRAITALAEQHEELGEYRISYSIEGAD
ncbi:MAG TPA: hypothetical protein VL172_10705 [Kofleriaceae bacterium]|jgi:hypothetical protein|nr:hypothetical protein [Kofleriaceae bacterium]